MASGEPIPKRTTVLDDPFVQGALHSILMHSSAGRHLVNWSWKTNSNTYDDAGIVLSHGFLRAAINNVRAASREMELNRVLSHLDHLESTDINRAQVAREAAARWNKALGRARAKAKADTPGAASEAIKDIAVKATIDILELNLLKGMDARRVEIPKVTFPDLTIAPAVLMNLLESKGCSGVVSSKPRVLHVAPLNTRIAGSSLAMVLGAFLSSKLSPSVVGYRPGASVARILGTANVAITRTHRIWALTTDLSGFFDNAPTGLAIQHLDDVVRLRPAMRTLVEVVTGYDGSPQHRLPQGCAISPLLANLYAAKRIDEVGQRLGPYLRYSDDVLLLLHDRDEALAAYTQFRHATRSAGIDVAMDKTRITNLKTGEGFSPDRPNVTTKEPLLYLGVDIRWVSQRKGVTFHLSNLAIRRLAENLRLALHRGGASRTNNEIERWRKRYVLILQTWRGWLNAYGGLRWSPEQNLAVATLLHGSHVTPARFQDYLLAAVAASGESETDVRKIFEEMVPIPKDLPIFASPEPLGKTMDAIRQDCQTRFERGLSEGIGLAWGASPVKRTMEKRTSWHHYDLRAWPMGEPGEHLDISELIVHDGERLGQLARVAALDMVPPRD